MRQALIIATKNRQEPLTQLLGALQDLERFPDELVLSATEESDIPVAAYDSYPFKVTITIGAKGLTAQRNAGIRALTKTVDIVTFLDDDSRPRRDFFARVISHFSEYPDSYAVTGRVILDGSPDDKSLSEEVITAALAQSTADDLDHGVAQAVLHDQLYGCNMAFRAEIFDQISFDERLPLYSWLEDADVARAIMRQGLNIYQDPRLVIVHCKVSSGGRTAHLRFGYSSVMNWEYLRRKGHVGWKEFPGSVLGPMIKNIAGSLCGSDRVGRRKRLRGNWLAMWDIARGRITPERATELAA